MDMNNDDFANFIKTSTRIEAHASNVEDMIEMIKEVISKQTKIRSDNKRKALLDLSIFTNLFGRILSCMYVSKKNDIQGYNSTFDEYTKEINADDITMHIINAMMQIYNC